MFNRNDPLIDAVKQVMAANDKEREAIRSVNEAFGIVSKNQLPHEKHAEYDAALSRAISGKSENLTEELKGNQHKIDANKNNRIDSHDFKLLRSKKEKKPEEHGVEAEREMAAKGKKMYEEEKEDHDEKNEKEEQLNEIGDTKKGKIAINKAMLRGDAEIADQAYRKRPNKKVLKKAERAVDLSIATHERRGGNVLGGYLKHAYGIKEQAERGQRIAEAVMSKLRAKKLKEESEDSDPAIVSEKAPSGAKFERMVKHIKAGYAKDGALSKKEKSIAYATAWKAKNKQEMKEGIFDSIKNFFGSGARQDAANASAKANAARVGTDPGAAASANRSVTQAPAGPRDSAPSTGPSGTSAQGMTMKDAINKSPALSGKFNPDTGKATTPSERTSSTPAGSKADRLPGGATGSAGAQRQAAPAPSAPRTSERVASQQANVPDSRNLRTAVKPAAGEGSTGKALAAGGISKQDRRSQSFVDSQLGAGKYTAGSAQANLALAAKSKAASSAVSSAENAGKASIAAKPAAAKPSLGGGVR